MGIWGGSCMRYFSEWGEKYVGILRARGHCIHFPQANKISFTDYVYLFAQGSLNIYYIWDFTVKVHILLNIYFDNLKISFADLNHLINLKYYSIKYFSHFIISFLALLIILLRILGVLLNHFVIITKFGHLIQLIVEHQLHLNYFIKHLPLIINFIILNLRMNHLNKT